MMYILGYAILNQLLKIILKFYNRAKLIDIISKFRMNLN